MEKNDKIVMVLSVALVISVAGWVSSMLPSIGTMTGAATSVTPESQVVVQKYFSINSSANLSAGIDFGTIESLPATNHNATKNWNYTDGGDTWHNETLYWITVEYDSNTPVDVCILATALNTSGGDEIGIANYTFANNQTNNITWPGIIDQFTMNTTNYTASDSDISIGSSSYLRFWLDVPASQATGTYNNTITILGVSTGTSCPY